MAKRIRRCAHGHRKRINLMLVVRQIDFGGRLLVEAAVFDVADNADDGLGPVARLSRELRGHQYLLTDGIECRRKTSVPFAR